MDAKPDYGPVGKFFQKEIVYLVPKYQRGYAWEQSEVESFLKDIGNCFTSRVSNSEGSHFFGGIVCVKDDIQGVIRGRSLELVDGQQRITSFVMLVAAIINKYKNILEVVEEGNDRTVIDERIKKLQERYIEFEVEIDRVFVTMQVLTLSKRDKDFFYELIRKNSPEVNGNSHRLLEDAFNRITHFVDTCINGETNIANIIDIMDHLSKVIEIDSNILQIHTHNKEEAYTLFQVLNNRGKSLTEGDLLRAKCLELVDSHLANQELIAKEWDEILKRRPEDILKHFKWIYISNTGKNPSSNNFYHEFLDHFFPLNNIESINITLEQSGDILNVVRSIKKELFLSEKILEGDWPYAKRTPILAWDRARLNLLVKQLGHTQVIPLLLSSVKLSHIKFNEIVQLVERFIFRYKFICNAHVGSLGKKYREECLAIRNNPTTYSILSLKTKLIALQNSNTTDAVFETNLKSLKYSRSKSNKLLKYFISSCEYFYKWFIQGATGEPICQEKSVLHSFSDTTIEHIYPRNPSEDHKEDDLEEFKDDLKNLTILAPLENSEQGNDPFLEKKEFYLESRVSLNSCYIGTKDLWSEAQMNEYESVLISIGNEVFKIS